MDFVVKNLGIIMTILFLISELIGENAKVRSNSIYGLIRAFLKGESLKAQPEVNKVITQPDTK